MKNYWRDLEELKLNENSKQTHAEGEGNNDLSLIKILEEETLSSRRNFLKLFGFSVVSTSVLSSCEKPVTKAIPYLIKPETIIPGKADYYASTFYDGEQYASILVKVRDGRPIKIDGNDLSSLSAGSSSAIAQASLLELYDDNRIKNPSIKGQEVNWEQLDVELVNRLKEIRVIGGTLALVSSSIISPSSLALIDEFKQEFPGFKHVMYDSMSVSGMLDANEAVFGQRIIPNYKFENADLIVSFGADFLGNWLLPSSFIQGYSTRKRLDDGEKTQSYHIQIETSLSLTGSNADLRIPIKPSQEQALIAALYNELRLLLGMKSLRTLSIPESIDIKHVANELYANKSKSLVVCGSNDKTIQILVNAINDLLGNYGNTIDLNQAIYTKKGDDKEFNALVKEMNNKDIDGVLFYNCNPVYDYSNKDELLQGLDKVSLKLAFSNSWDETSKAVDYVCPDSHYLESWSDANPQEGFYSLGQPVIRTLFNTRQVQDSLLKWLGKEMIYLDYLKEYWKKNFHVRSDIELFGDFWNDTLQKGVFILKTDKKRDYTSDFKLVEELLNTVKSAPASDALEYHLYENNTIGSGKHANNPWLQETPDAISKITWDNYAAISPKYAHDNNLNTGDVILLNDHLAVPVYLQPGQTYGTLSIAVGYGRKVTGIAGVDVGVNVYPLSNFKNGNTRYEGVATFVKTEDTFEFAMTQTHNSMEGRAIIREATLEEYLKDPAAGNEMHEEIEHHLDSLYEKHKYEGHHWGMTVDLNSCIGCNACVVSCTAENNVPVVGKNEVRRVHEMHWIRIDRYYSGDSENPEVSRQPVMCQHCDNAPCENVCPVAATTHSSEGINQMAYNRCIGTRYCNNNCPYKVRRFNWFDYNQADALPGNTMDPAGMSLDLPRMVLNPDVTVRAKGVMEKCSFCIQRVQEKKLKAKAEGRALMDGEIKTACQQACPTKAITFGDMSDKNSRVTHLLKDKRSYHLLEELHTLPSVGYLTRIRNKKA